ncbi:Outer membrane protein beta-barrel domain-containing protein [Halopseudomonas litoralis]|uniref:Outer membrane protein beta-barrel domain-containing protein n=1 Tax=Halopseudomonas litoralis TaxID=797277 RepID=A0A1H1Y606_9GAMM|nr:porin family protein [Halopseudomonas litoralis]SDT16466.1 Outer membrane protein beta-barrel domain-containing protein [Halopseudomonas litoralis]
MLRKSLLAILVSGAMVAGVQAAEIQPNGYLFGNIGKSDADTPDYISGLDRELGITANDFGLGFGSDYDEQDSAFKVGAGIQINRHVGLEFQYIDLGTVTYKARLSDGIDTLNAKVTGGTDGFGANVVGTLPFDRFKLLGKIGYHKLKTEVKEKVSVVGIGTFAEGKESVTEWVSSFGVGASYAFTPQIELVAEFERYQDVADEYDVDFASIGLRYNF